MMKILVLLVCGLIGQARAESLGQEIFRDLASPVTTKALLPFTIGAGSTTLLYGFKHELGDPLQDSWTTHKPLGDGAKYGDLLGQMIPNAMYALGMGVHTWTTGDKKSRARAILMLKASAYAASVNTVLKLSVREPRPNGSRDMASFPSGHSATAFAFASVVGAEHEWYYGVAAYSLATFVAASRINDNKHRLHDVVGGATIGIAYGLGLYYRARQVSAQSPATVYNVLPTDRMDGVTLSVHHEF